MILPFLLVGPQASAHGPASCSPNEYVGKITAMTLILPDGTSVDPIAHPNTTIILSDSQTYSVTFTIHTASESMTNNTNPGQTWFETDAGGVGFAQCVPSGSTIGPSQDLTLTLSNYQRAGVFAPGPFTQVVNWYDKSNVAGTEVQYNVHWTGNATTTSSSTSSTASSTTSSSTFLSSSSDSLSSLSSESQSSSSSSTTTAIASSPSSTSTTTESLSTTHNISDFSGYYLIATLAVGITLVGIVAKKKI